MADWVGPDEEGRPDTVSDFDAALEEMPEPLRSAIKAREARVAAASQGTTPDRETPETVTDVIERVRCDQEIDLEDSQVLVAALEAERERHDGQIVRATAAVDEERRAADISVGRSRAERDEAEERAVRAEADRDAALKAWRAASPQTFRAALAGGEGDESNANRTHGTRLGGEGDDG